MNKTRPTPEDLITALDGPVAVARLLTTEGHPITSQGVTAWKTAGIPSDRLVQLALAKGRVLRSTTDIEPANWPRLFPELLAPGKSSKAS
jgi:hypothetical protein